TDRLAAVQRPGHLQLDTGLDRAGDRGIVEREPLRVAVDLTDTAQPQPRAAAQLRGRIRRRGVDDGEPDDPVRRLTLHRDHVVVALDAERLVAEWPREAHGAIDAGSVHGGDQLDRGGDRT